MLNQFYHSLNPIAFSIGPLVVRWYGIAYLLGIIVGAWIVHRVARWWKINLSFDDILVLAVGLAFGILIGGRLGYVVFYAPTYYLSHPLSIFMLSDGGMSFHGGLIGVVVGGSLACRYLNLSWRTIADLLAIATPAGLFFGRCANFVNGELWGKPTNLPWGVVFPDAGPLPRHPSQLYEAFLEGIVLLVILIILARHKPPLPQGTFLGVFLLGYGIARFAVEFIRVPDVQLGYLIGFLTMGQLLSIPLIIIGAVELYLSQKRQWKQRKTEADEV